MIFAQTWQKVLDGSKTQTRRLKRGPYKVGKTYSVQPGRGKKAVGWIRMKRIWEQGIWAMSEQEVKAEGFGGLLTFVWAFRAVNGLEAGQEGKVWAFEFELVESG